MYTKVITLSLLFSISFTFYINSTQTYNRHISSNISIYHLRLSMHQLRNQQNYEWGQLMHGKSLLNSFACIATFLEQKFDKQWDLFIQSRPSPDAIYFWSFNKCVLQLNNYGPYNRTIYIWEVEKQQTHIVSEKSKIINFNNKQIETNNIVEMSKKSQLVSAQDDCSSYRVLAVQSAISSCDIEGNSNAAACISNKVDSKIGQKWGTIVKSNGDSMASVWVYGNCWVNAMNVGVYKRTINVWKAQV